MRLMATLAAALLVLAACGGTDDTGALPTNPDAVDGAGDLGATCLAGEPDCADDPSNPDGGQALPPPDLGDVTIADLLDGGPGFPVTVHGFVVAEGTDFQLCELLAESFPPQCGGLSIPIGGVEQVQVGEFASEGAVSWIDAPVSLYGEVVDGVFVLVESSDG